MSVDLNQKIGEKRGNAMGQDFVPLLVVGGLAVLPDNGHMGSSNHEIASSSGGVARKRGGDFGHAHGSPAREFNT
jgi:hypothetical protein